MHTCASTLWFKLVRVGIFQMNNWHTLLMIFLVPEEPDLPGKGQQGPLLKGRTTGKLRLPCFPHHSGLYSSWELNWSLTPFQLPLPEQSIMVGREETRHCTSFPSLAMIRLFHLFPSPLWGPYIFTNFLWTATGRLKQIQIETLCLDWLLQSSRCLFYSVIWKYLLWGFIF